MPLTVQQNGSVVGGQPNTAMASWWNDYHDLLTGVMTDQLITLKTDVRIKATNSSAPVAPTLALSSSTNLGIGVYQYAYTYLDAQGGETLLGAVASITTTSGNQGVTITTLPIGPTGTASRNIYRTKVGGTNFYKLVNIGNNTSSSNVYTDTVTDAALSSTPPPAHPYFGGALFFYNAAGTRTGQIFSDGAVWFDTGAISSDGNGNLSVSGISVSTFNTFGSSTVGVSFKDQSGNVEFDAVAPSGSARGIVFAGLDTAGTLHQGILVNPTGIVSLGTNRNGSVANVQLYTGSTTPTGDGATTPATGAIWVKA